MSQDSDLEIAKAFVEANKENQIIKLILERARRGHKLSEPFEIITGWSTDQCIRVTIAVNLVLEDMNAGFRVLISHKKDEKKQK